MKIENGIITFEFLPDDKEPANLFFTSYDFHSFDFVTTNPIKSLKVKNERICRYCSKKIPEVSFDNEAHLYPEFLGNKYSVSDFECDTCNKKFGKLEKQLSNFIGPFITLNGTKGKKKIPCTPSHDGKMLAAKGLLFDSKIIELGVTDNNPSHIHYNPNTNSFEIPFTKQPYVPKDVYKAFLKIALGMLDESEVSKFDAGFKMLNDKTFAKTIIGPIVSVNVYSVSVPYNYTGIVMFKKRNDSDIIPTYVMVLFYRQFMFQFLLPFEDSFFLTMKKLTIAVPILPPILSTEKIEIFHCNKSYERLDSEISKSVVQTIVLQPDTKDVKQVGMDLETKEMVDGVFDPSKIVKFILGYQSRVDNN